MGFQRKRQLNQYTNLLNEFQDVSRSFKQYLETSNNTTAVTYVSYGDDSELQGDNKNHCKQNVSDTEDLLHASNSISHLGWSCNPQ